MTAQKILRATTTTLVSYPRISDGDFVLGVPSTPEVRISTPATAFPDEDDAWPTGTVDPLSATVSTAAAQGDTTIAVAAVFDPDFDVDAAEDAVAAALVALGFVEFAVTSAEILVAAGAESVATFRTELDANEADIEQVTGPLTSADLDTVEAAFASVASPTPAWVKGRKYLLTDVADVVVFTSAKTVTGTTAYLTEPLERAITIAATVKGFAITKALTATQTDQVGGGVAVFRAVVDGVTVSWSHAFRIVRRMVVIPLTGSELTATYAVAHSMKPATQTFEEVIAAGWQLLLLKLGAKKVREEDIVDAEVLRPVLALACIVHLARIARTVEPTWRESLNTELDQMVETTMRNVGWNDADQTVDPPRDPPIRSLRGGGLRMRR